MSGILSVASRFIGSRGIGVKSLAALAGNTEVRSASRFVVAGRLSRLRHYMERLLSTKSGDDVESVHQIRVFCRRLQAALDVLADALPQKHVRRLTKRLRRIRREAGHVRDADVLAIELKRVRDLATPAESPAIDHLLDLYPRKRARALERLVCRIDKLDRRDFWDWVAKQYPADLVVDDLRVARGRDRSILDLSRDRVDDELSTFLSAFEDHADGNIEQLHQLRLAAKRFRYVLEVFAGCFGSEFRERVYEPIKQLQESLGSINDAHAFAQQLDRLAHLTDEDELAASLSRLRDRYVVQLDEHVRQFNQLWSVAERDAYVARVRQLLNPPPPSPEKSSDDIPLSPIATNPTSD